MFSDTKYTFSDTSSQKHISYTAFGERPQTPVPNSRHSYVNPIYIYLSFRHSFLFVEKNRRKKEYDLCIYFTASCCLCRALFSSLFYNHNLSLIFFPQAKLKKQFKKSVV